MRFRSAIVATTFLCSLVALPESVAGATTSPTTTPTPTQTATPLAAPANLTMTVGGTTKLIPGGGWSNKNSVDLHFQVQVPTGGSVTPQIELEPFSIPFSGQSNISAPPITTSGTAAVHLSNLQNGRTYHWQARLSASGGGVSSWTPYAGVVVSKPDFGVDMTSPSRPEITSSTNPNPNDWYNAKVVQIGWHARDTNSGVTGYTIALLRSPHVIPVGQVIAQHGARLTNLADGVWFVALRAVDAAGNWSPTATFRLLLDRQPAHIVWLSARRFTFNPYRGPASVKFRLSKSARTRLALYRVGDIRPTATYWFPNLQGGRVATVTWNGKDAKGQPVKKGYYFFSATLTDRASNLTRVNVGGIDVNPQAPTKTVPGPTVFPGDGKRIIVQLSRETLYAYDGAKLVLQTYVTTGNPSLPTPAGHYSVMAKYHPYEFVSPWPLGSPYYYPPSWSQYAMLFRDGGYFLHDAPWRSAFGPGTNGPGQPGTNYGGTHGCVNIPPDPMVFLWNWTPVGTTVDVIP